MSGRAVGSQIVIRTGLRMMSHIKQKTQDTLSLSLLEISISFITMSRFKHMKEGWWFRILTRIQLRF